MHDHDTPGDGLIDVRVMFVQDKRGTFNCAFVLSWRTYPKRTGGLAVKSILREPTRQEKRNAHRRACSAAGMSIEDQEDWGTADPSEREEVFLINEIDRARAYLGCADELFARIGEVKYAGRIQETVDACRRIVNKSTISERVSGFFKRTGLLVGIIRR